MIRIVSHEDAFGDAWVAIVICTLCNEVTEKMVIVLVEDHMLGICHTCIHQLAAKAVLDLGWQRTS
jgi:hypothetical protein